MNMIAAAEQTQRETWLYLADNETPGFEIAHLQSMLDRMKQGDMSEGKLGCWLGWFQAACVINSDGDFTLNDCKRINMENREEDCHKSSFQSDVAVWIKQCFGIMTASDKIERNHRFLEEALELVQSTGCTREEAYKLVDYVYDRPAGETHQEIGGVMVTLAALCQANGFNMDQEGDRELARVNRPEIIEKIRAKQKAKPKYGPLPEHKGIGDV